MEMEVELKAWIDDPDLMREKLKAAFPLLKEVRKEDVYFKLKGSGPHDREPVRLRKNGSQWQVTFKKRAIHEGMEMNEEHEFEVGSAEEFMQLMAHMDMEPYVKKIKDSTVFQGPEEGLTLELNHLHTLGWFLEIEWLVSESHSPARMRSRLIDLYTSLGISEEKIEPRYYTDMLLNGV